MSAPREYEHSLYRENKSVQRSLPERTGNIVAAVRHAVHEVQPDCEFSFEQMAEEIGVGADVLARFVRKHKVAYVARTGCGANRITLRAVVEALRAQGVEIRTGW